MRFNGFALGLIEGRDGPRLFVEGVIVSRRDRAKADEMYGLVNPELRAFRTILNQVEQEQSQLFQADFDPTDDANVASWARLMHVTAAAQVHQFSTDANVAIISYRETNRRTRLRRSRSPHRAPDRQATGSPLDLGPL
jgi:hypothetical protein